MYILELNYPGTWIEGDDPELAHQAEWILTLLEGQFTEAVLALNLFEEESSKRLTAPDDGVFPSSRYRNKA